MTSIMPLCYVHVARCSIQIIVSNAPQVSICFTSPVADEGTKRTGERGSPEKGGPENEVQRTAYLRSDTLSSYSVSRSASWTSPTKWSSPPHMSTTPLLSISRHTGLLLPGVGPREKKTRTPRSW